MVKVGDLLKVTRDDIQDFPGDSIQQIMDLQKEGWRAQRSNRNHVMLFAPDGQTRLSVSRNPSSPRYLAEDIRKYKAGEAIQEHPEEQETEVPAHAKFPCPQMDCVKFYASQEKLNVHIAVDHEGYLLCPEKDCDEVRDTQRKLNLHRSKAHGYESPRKAQRLAAKKLKDNQAALVKTLQENQAAIEEKEVLDSLPEYNTKMDQAAAEIQRNEETNKPLVEFIVHPLGRGDAVVEETMTGAIFDTREVRPMTEREREFKVLAATLPDLDQAVGWDTGEDGEVVRTIHRDESLEFIDERDSWVINISDISDRRVGTLEQVFKAAGLSMEIRIWQTDKGD